jgi:hypothetical protein
MAMVANAAACWQTRLRASATSTPATPATEPEPDERVEDLALIEDAEVGAVRSVRPIPLSLPAVRNRWAKSAVQSSGPPFV